MLKLKINNYSIVLSILIILLLISTKFFHHISNIYSNKYEDRINKTYGYCKNESIGYLTYLKKNFKLHNNPKIVNYVHTPPVDWSIFDAKRLNKNSNNIILLNYPGNIIKLNYEKKSDNIFNINNLSFYKDKIKKIDSILIFFDKPVRDNEIEIDLYSEINLGERNLINKFKENKKQDKNTIKFDINLDINKIYPKNNNISFKVKNLDKNLISEINILAENKYIIENLNLVNKHKNCFLIKK